MDEEERFFVEALGFRKTGVDGAWHRFEIGTGGAGKTLVLLHEPNRPSGSLGFGAGTAHHVAIDVPDDEALAKQKGFFEELGYTDCSEIKDRNYFHSIYMLLPPWFEARRAEIMSMLDPIRIPEWHAPVAGPRITASRRTEATFVPVDSEVVVG